MNRLFLASLLALATLAACKVGGGETTTGPVSSCMPAGNACAQNADCCSYGCQGNLCVPNPVEGGTCRTSNDCSFLRLCKSGACTTPTTAMCRDTGDVCSTWYAYGQCCSGNCAAGSCAPNHPPVAAFTITGADASGNVPYHALLTLQNGSTDPDGDTLYYTWAITARPTGSTAALSGTTVASPTFTPDFVGDYSVQLTVVDGPTGQPSRLTTSVTKTFHAVNVPPVVSAGLDVTASRNVPLTLSGSATDSDADPLTCTWRATPPGGGAAVVLGTAGAACNGTVTATFLCSGTYTYPTAPAVEGVWTVTLTATDGPNSVGSTAHVTCVNDPPAANAGPAQVWNLSATAPSTTSVPLAGGFTDPNGDGAYSWQWTILTPAPGSTSFTAGTVLGTTQNTSFVPDVAGRYVVQVQVCDRPLSCGTSTANVDVYRYIQDFGDARAVHAVDYAHGVNKIAMAGPDPANTLLGKVWLRDPANPTSPGNEISASLDAVPDFVAVTPAGDWAVAGNSLWLWVVKLSVAPPTVTRLANSLGSLGSIAIAGTEALVFPASGTTFFAHFTYTTASSTTALTSAGYTGHVGRVDAAGAYLYVLDKGWPDITRYAVTKTGGFGLAYMAREYLSYPSTVGDLWPSADGAHLFLSSGEIQAVTTLTTGGNLGVAPRSVDSLTGGQTTALAPDRLWLFNSALTHTGDDVLPQWGVGGVGYVLTADGGFVRLDPLDATKTIRYVVVHANGTTPLRSGLVTFP